MPRQRLFHCLLRESSPLPKYGRLEAQAGLDRGQSRGPIISSFSQTMSR